MNSQQGTRTQTPEAVPGDHRWMLDPVAKGQSPGGGGRTQAWLGATFPSRRDGRVALLHHGAATRTDRAWEGPLARPQRQATTRALSSKCRSPPAAARSTRRSRFTVTLCTLGGGHREDLVLFSTPTAQPGLEGLEQQQHNSLRPWAQQMLSVCTQSRNRKASPLTHFWLAHNESRVCVPPPTLTHPLPVPPPARR